MMDSGLRRDAVKGVGWAFFSSVSVRLLQIVTTLTLAKLLVPADFGVFALCSLVIQAIAIFRDMGFSQVLIYRQGSIGKLANTVFVLNLAFSLVLAIFLFASAGLVGKLLSTSQIIWPLRVMSATLLVSGLANVPLALLDKQLKFKIRAIPEVAGAFTYAAVSIILAAIHPSSWSLVIGWMSMVAATTIAAWLVTSWRPSMEFDWGEARVIAGYGKHLMAASLLGFAFFQIDNASVGKWLGVTALGFYSMAFTVCNIPATNMAHVVNRVMFPTYSRLQNDLEGMRKVYLSTIKYISMASFPSAIGLFVLSDPIIRTFYHDKWIPAIPLFHVLAFYGLARSIGATPGAVFMSQGKPDLVRRVSMINLLIAGSLVYPVVKHFGTIGVAVLFTSAYLVGTLYALGKVQRLLGMGVLGCLKAVRVSLAASVIAGLAAWLPSSMANWQAVALGGLAMGVVYGGSVHLLDRSAFKEMKALLSKSRGSA